MATPAEIKARADEFIRDNHATMGAVEPEVGGLNEYLRSIYITEEQVERTGTGAWPGWTNENLDALAVLIAAKVTELGGTPYQRPTA